MRPLTKNGDNGTYVKYYPSSPFLPSVALGALLTTNLLLIDSASYSPLRENAHKPRMLSAAFTISIS